jgi:hypothetical protein
VSKNKQLRQLVQKEEKTILQDSQCNRNMLIIVSHEHDPLEQRLTRTVPKLFKKIGDIVVNQPEALAAELARLEAWIVVETVWPFAAAENGK